MLLPLRRVLVLCLCGLLAACAPPTVDTGEPAAVTAAVDDGEGARLAALDLLGGAPMVDETPDIVGLSPAEATSLLSELGLDIDVVAFDRTMPVTTQWPPAGQPVPLDSSIEAWLGAPPEAVATDGPLGGTTEGDEEAGEDAAPLLDADDVAGQVDPVDEAALLAAQAELDQIAAAQTPSYVLPPHTDGMLRINPRFLPALPQGTQLVGRASWYGPGFHGLQTACGGIYDQNGPTLASREMRCGTVVRITGPTGLTVEATVTDWGPAEWTGRRFDLSAAVFNAISPLGAGVIDVNVVTANVPS